MQLALGALAVYNLRPSDHTPLEEVTILWASEGACRHGSAAVKSPHGGPALGACLPALSRSNIHHLGHEKLSLSWFFRSNRAHRVFLRSSTPDRRPPAPTNGSAKTFTRR